jgi:hypothetical protein
VALTTSGQQAARLVQRIPVDSVARNMTTEQQGPGPAMRTCGKESCSIMTTTMVTHNYSFRDVLDNSKKVA